MKSALNTPAGPVALQTVATLRRHLMRWQGQHDQIVKQANQANQHRLPWILGLLFVLFGVGAGVGWQELDAVDSGYALFTRMNTMVDVAIMVLLAVLFAGLKLARRLPRLAAWLRFLPEGVGGFFLLLGVVMSMLSQSSLPSASMFVVCTTATGALLLIRPRVALVLFGTSFVAFFVAIGHSGVPCERLPTSAQFWRQRLSGCFWRLRAMGVLKGARRASANTPMARGAGEWGVS